MGCKICDKSACASWMHSLEEQEARGSLEDWSESRLKLEIISLRGEVKDLKSENSNLEEEIIDLKKQLCDAT